MEQERTQPPAYISHNPAELKLPSAPQADISHAHAVAELTLPDLKTVLSPAYQESSLPSDVRSSTKSPVSVRSLPRIDPGPQYNNGEHRSLDVAVASPSEAGSAMSVDEPSIRSPSISMDDPDVQIAAKALSELGNPGMPF